ncbi:hypothetical protein QFZ94_008501 [Paraburkholderia sp. JPY465]|uniref:hypothetical protein n=1 Tax=Paraburkholderia sp. JPY465 TaxID=3042285 RepID=UPI003D20700E
MEFALGQSWNPCSVCRGIGARLAVESVLGLLWNQRSVCCGISVRFGVEYAHEFWALRGLDIGVPSFGLVSERFRTLEVQVKQRCARVAERLRNGEAISLIVDSSGMNFWPGQRMASAKVRARREPDAVAKMHLSIDRR